MTRTHEFADGKLVAATDAGIGTLTFHNEQRKNAITAAMWRDIPRALHFLSVDAGARVIIVAGAGGQDFSAGADISEFATVRKDAETARAYELDNSIAFRAIRSVRVPTIAAIRGICYGGGFGVAAACDLRLADESARFAIPAARLGLAYPADAVQDIVLALGNQTTRKLLYTGLPITAREIETSGFLLETFSDVAELEKAVFALAGSIAGNAPLSIAASKLAIRAVTESDNVLMSEAEVLGTSTFESADYAEGRAAFAERRKPVFRGE
ncbi:enoyl-CoA hydratase-related protein [Rhizobiaceae bacterium BDR2-2]|uniref:Enoyl-CoA hydratase-related protein n=1 Tax=Ectorhizobium quercum TaxID=2965071 RepID=A0AAE3SUU4_9HYPH|nr:enoyl-CoA hydratase-related protein [Ectorhizobium quercum]MCX8997610.1 enoyl-CoA hydratase-related protein [Ectorhizobium quercum]